MACKLRKRKIIGRIDGGKKRLCNGKSRQTGKPCKQYAMPNGKCRFHGGMNSSREKAERRKAAIAERKKENPGKPMYNEKGAHHPAVSVGIYADVGLLDNEGTIYADVQNQIGTLTEELNMARIKLRRAYQAQKQLDNVKDALSAAAGNKDEFIRVALTHKLLTVDQLEDYAGREPVGSWNDRYLEDITKHRMIRKVRDYSDDIRKFSKLVKELEQAQKELRETVNMGDYVEQIAIDLDMFFRNADKTIPKSKMAEKDFRMLSGIYPNNVEQS